MVIFNYPRQHRTFETYSLLLDLSLNTDNLVSSIIDFCAHRASETDSETDSQRKRHERDEWDLESWRTHIQRENIWKSKKIFPTIPLSEVLEWCWKMVFAIPSFNLIPFVLFLLSLWNHAELGFLGLRSSPVWSLSQVWLFATPWTTARQACLTITNSWSPPKPTSIESVMPSNHLILCRPLLLLS